MAVKGKAAADGWAKKAVAAAKAGGVPVEGPTGAQAEQQELLKRDVPVVPMVQGEKFCVRFVKDAGIKKEEDERVAPMDFSTALTPEHDDLLPRSVLKSVEFMRAHHVGTVGKIQIPDQWLEVFLSPELPCSLKIPGAPASRVTVDRVLEKGAGKENKILRLSWRLTPEATPEVVEFMRLHVEDSVWITMKPAQRSLEENAA